MEVLGQIAAFVVLVGLFAGVCTLAWMYVRRRKFREGMPGGADSNLAAVYRVGAFDVVEIPPGHLDHEDESGDLSEDGEPRNDPPGTR